MDPHTPHGFIIAGWGPTAASAGAYHGGIAAAAAAMKGTTDLGPHSGYHPAAAHHQLMADMYQGMSPATAINTMDWKNTSQVSFFLLFLSWKGQKIPAEGFISRLLEIVENILDFFWLRIENLC